MKKIVLFLAALTLTTACSPEYSHELTTHDANPSIVGGTKVNTASKIGRSTVGLYEEDIGYICSGTLIAKNLVLTAAHCVDPKAKNLKAIFGPEIKKASAQNTRQVTAAVVNKNYVTKNQLKDLADIAVIRLDKDAPAGYEPARLLFDPQYLNNGVNTIVAGYGISWTIGIGAGAGTLRTTTLAIDDVNFSRTEVALGQSVRRGICSGDSGGPAYLDLNGQLHVWGVASRGDSIPIFLVPKCMILSIFTRVDAYQEFIQSAMAQLNK